MNSNQLAQFDDEHGELDVASPDGPDAGTGPTGFAGELNGATGAGRAINTTAVVLGIIVSAAAVGIVSMRWVGQVTAKAPAGQQASGLAAEIPKLLADMETGGENPLKDERGDPKERQVPADDVQKNPFFIPDVDTVTDTTTTVAPEVVDPEQIRRERRQMIEQAANRVVVNSLLTGRSPVAILDDRAVRINDEVFVDDWVFIVESIDSAGVTLVYEDPLLRDPVRVIRGMESDDRRSSRRRPGRSRR